MNTLIDKLIIFFFCSTLYIQSSFSIYIIVPIIITIIFSSLASIFEKDIVKTLIFVTYIILSIFYKNFIYFLPLICYDIFTTKSKYILLFAILPFGINFAKLTLTLQVLIPPFIGIVCLMKYRSILAQKSKLEYIYLRDSSKEFLINLEDKNKELMEKQDYEINIATLNERNRIAREIHDNLGHSLSSSILQIGALMSVCKDTPITSNLSTLKNTLSDGMDNIRNSIHNMHDEYVDLHSEINTIINNFSFCNIAFNYNIESNPDKKYKICFISIIKESLSNIIKHSNATIVDISIREHPALYQLIIKDNGTRINTSNNEGIGLKNMLYRINSLNGIININTDNGYCIFISIPK
jgi:signal transduction histidine kinase